MHTIASITNGLANADSTALLTMQDRQDQHCADCKAGPAQANRQGKHCIASLLQQH